MKGERLALFYNVVHSTVDYRIRWMLSTRLNLLYYSIGFDTLDFGMYTFSH
jgi:hypothetical protein